MQGTCEGLGVTTEAGAIGADVTGPDAIGPDVPGRGTTEPREWNGLIVQAAKRLADAGVASPVSDARELAEFAAGVRRLPLNAPTSEQLAAFAHAVERRAGREPLQHITGRMYFRYLELVSRPGAFIVRPETEMVAQDAIDEARKVVARGERPRVVDLCTGSGAIALAVATEVPGAHVLAIDISDEALAVAAENNAAYGNPVVFLQGDAMEFSLGPRDSSGAVARGGPVGARGGGVGARGGAVGARGGAVASRGGAADCADDARSCAFDVVVANPPYIPAHHELSPEVLADPAAALWGGGARGLNVPASLVERATALLRPGGLLVMEHAEEQAEALRRIASNAGFVKARTGVDLSGRPRWLHARLPLDEH